MSHPFAIEHPIRVPRIGYAVVFKGIGDIGRVMHVTQDREEADRWLVGRPHAELKLIHTGWLQEVR